MLPIVRPYEYLIIQKLINSTGSSSISELTDYLAINIDDFKTDVFDHAIKFMLESGYFIREKDAISFSNIVLNLEFEDYLDDLIKYGLGKYAIDFDGLEAHQLFKPWAKYRTDQVQQLILKKPITYQQGTQILDNVVYAYVTVIKGNNTKEHLKYSDGYIDDKTFQWETVAGITKKQLNKLKNSRLMHIFVRKVEKEDGLTLPFTYIGSGKMEYVENSKKENNAHLFHIPISEAPEDIFFDFKLPN